MTILKFWFFNLLHLDEDIAEVRSNVRFMNPLYEVSAGAKSNRSIITQRINQKKSFRASAEETGNDIKYEFRRCN